MSAPKTLTLTLPDAEGQEQRYEIKPLLWSQVEDIFDAVMFPDTTPAQRRLRNAKVVAIALSDSYPDITVDTLLRMRVGTLQGLNAASSAVLSFSGFVAPASEPASGEEGAPPSA